MTKVSTDKTLNLFEQIIVNTLTWIRMTPTHHKKMRLCIEGVTEQLEKNHPNENITPKQIFEHLDLSKILTLCLEERQNSSSNHKLSAYLKTLPGINLSDCALGPRGTQAIKRHNHRIKRSGAAGIILFAAAKELSVS